MFQRDDSTLLKAGSRAALWGQSSGFVRPRHCAGILLAGPILGFVIPAAGDGKILCRDRELHEFGYISVSYEQAQIARQHGWRCRSGVFLEAGHSDEKSWAYVEDERLYALEYGEEPPLVRIYRKAPPSCAIDTPASCRIPSK